MKKLLSILFVLAVAAGLWACGPADDGVRFVVGFDAEFAPYGFLDGDEYKGFDLDLAREVCRRRGWTFVAHPLAWDAKDEALESGAVTCIWNGFTMQGREDDYEWTSAYVDNSQVVLVLADSALRTLGDVVGRNVGVQVDTPVLETLQPGGDCAEFGASLASLHEFPTCNDAVAALENGAVDAVAMDIGVAKQKMSDRPGAFHLLDEAVMTETYGIGFKKGNAELRDQVWATYQELLADGTVATLAAQYGVDGVIR